MATQRNPLLELTKVCRVEPPIEFRLADQHDLKKLAALILQIAEEANFLEHFPAQKMRLVNDQDRGLIDFLALREECVKLKKHFALILAGDGQTQVRHGVAEKLFGRKQSVENIGVLNTELVQLIREAAEHESLSGAYFAGHDHESFVRADTVVKTRERFVMARRRVHEIRIRADIERIPFQMEEGLIHPLSSAIHVIFGSEHRQYQNCACAPLHDGFYRAHSLFARADEKRHAHRDGQNEPCAKLLFRMKGRVLDFDQKG